MRFSLMVPFFLLFQTAGYAKEDSGLFIVELEAKTVEERSRIANLIHIDSVVDDRVFAVVNSEDLMALNKDSSLKLISKESLKGRTKVDGYYEPFMGVIDFPEGDTAYHTYDETTAALQSLEKAHPGVASVFSIGKSIEGRDIWGLRISDDSEQRAEKKAIVYMGTHHAREHLSTEIAILFAEEMLNRAVAEAHIQELLKTTEIFVIPIVNPDGTTYDITNKNYKWWRKNRVRNHDGSYGVDLNRNYGHGWGTGGSSSNPGSDVYMGRAAFSEPETSAIKDFFLAHTNVTVALSLHTFSELILYPWGGLYEGIGGEDEKIFIKMAADMAKMNHYRPMQSSDLYIASGDTCDWLYGERSIFCFTFELSPSSMFSGGFYPGAEIIPEVLKDNFEPMLYLANRAKDPRASFEN